jgi:hypothetical protein
MHMWELRSAGGASMPEEQGGLCRRSSDALASLVSRLEVLSRVVADLTMLFKTLQRCDICSLEC